ncbi:MAG TPA: hypothetical protein VN442_25780 [Bryobacteraceae bacterium]|nr:hypothetical protein [Bryobacteraceae bacterium]
MSTASEILSRVKIGDVFHALTGQQPHRAGRDTWRAAATWRDGDGLNVSGDESLAVWHDFATDEGGGVLDLIVRVRGGSRQDALRWLAEYTGTPLEDRPLSPEERAEYARKRDALERDLPKARYWKRAAVLLVEETLDGLKAALFAPDTEMPDPREIQHLEGTLLRLRRLDGAPLVKEYRDWCILRPAFTETLVRFAEKRERAEREALLAYFAVTDPEVSAA